MTPLEVYNKYRLDPAQDMHPFAPFLRLNARGNILEIGVRGGVSTAAFLLGIEQNGGHLFSVDKTAICKNLFAGHPQWTFVNADSQDHKSVYRAIGPDMSAHEEPTPAKPYATSFDIVFLDGAHYRQGIRSDLENYAPLVKRGGMVLVHDIFGTKNPTPEQLAEDWPTEAVGEEFYAYARANGWPTFELPGEFGMGVAIRL